MARVTMLAMHRDSVIALCRRLLGATEPAPPDRLRTGRRAAAVPGADRPRRGSPDWRCASVVRSTRSFSVGCGTSSSTATITSASRPLVGAQMRYAVHDRNGCPLAMLGFSTAAWKSRTAATTSSDGHRNCARENLARRVVANPRFLIHALDMDHDPQPRLSHPRPRATPPARRLGRARLHDPRSLIETFVEIPRFTGARLQGIGWTHVGYNASGAMMTLRPRQALRPASKGRLAPTPSTGLATNPQSIESHPVEVACV